MNNGLDIIVICSVFSPTALYSLRTIGENMFENIVYVGLGFAAVFFALESAWHFAACKVRDKSIKPCCYKLAY
jgi:hypothetical protein